MRKFLCLVLLAFTGYTYGQSISGTLTDATSGEPLPFASIYVAETGSGTVTNVEGNYVLRLSPGRYTVKFQSIGYVAQERSIQVGSSGTLLDIALVQRGVDLQTIDVISSGEDVSYPVIRRAIAKAGYHRQQVDRYEALVYIKGTGKI
ncbi:MAG: carboxypeptidase-like regulatory domain-containing protein, partial [Bacteroidota bacterium]